ncbi:MAG: GntR family transcriptional regulator [Alteraurantiacibacter sp.]
MNSVASHEGGLDDAAPGGQERDGETLAQKVFLQLRADILAGRIAPGKSLTIRGLAEGLGVSAMPVREALRRLISERALELQDNRRVRIPPMSIERFEELLHARVTLETEAAERALPYIDKERLAQLKQIDRAVEEASGRKDLDRWMELNFRFHSCIYEARPHSALVPLIESLWLQIAPFMRRALMEIEGHYVEDRHVEALAAIEARNRMGLRIAIEADIRDGISHIGNQLIESDTRKSLVANNLARRRITQAS